MKFNKIKIVNIFIILIASIFIFFIVPETAYAWWWEDTSSDTVKFLQEHSEWLQFGGFLSIIGHELLWWLVKGLYLLSSSLEKLIPQTFNLLDFLDYAGVSSLTKSILNDLVVALMVISLVFLGFKFAIGKEPPKFKSVGINIAISAILLLGLPALMDTMQDISIKFYNATQTGTNNEQVSSLTWGLIQDNTADLVYISNNGFDLIKNGAGETNKNALTPNLFKAIKLTEVITPSSIDSLDTENEQLEHLKYTLSNDGSGGFTATEIEGSMLSVFSDNFESGYFRYPVKFFPIIIGLSALTVAYVFAIIVLITTIVEIGIKGIVSQLVFATDLESGQRTKMVVQDIASGYMLIAFTGLSFKMYTLFLTFLGTSNINLIIYVMAVVASTFVLIKGSSTLMRFFGVDVGIKEGYAQMAGAFALGRSTAGGIKKIGSLGSNEKSKENGKNNLAQQDEENQSINDTKGKQSALKSSVNTAGKSLGYMKERGFSGMAEDAIKGSGEQIANKGKSVKDNISAVGKTAKQGFEEGIVSGQENKEKWNSKKNGSLNDSPGEEKENKTVNGGLNRGELGNISDSKGLNTNQKQNIQQELNSINNKSPKEEKALVSEERTIKENTQNTGMPTSTVKEGITESINDKNSRQELVQDMKLNDLNSNPQRQEIKQDVSSSSLESKNSGLKESNGSYDTTRPSLNRTVTNDENGASKKAQTIKNNVINDQKSEPIKSNSVSRQSVVQESQKPIAIPQQATQRINQQLENAGYRNTDQVKQKVIQEIQQNATGNSEMKQRIIQNIEQANVATPQQASQNIKQVISSARLPQDTKRSVQKVIQEVQKSGSATNEQLKQKVVQELETTSFGNKEPLKQVIIQDIKKAFSTTPDQMKENIKQAIDIVETRNVTETINQNNNNQSSLGNTKTPSNQSNSYFGSLFGESIDDYQKSSIKNKKDRFDFLKGE